MSNTNTVFIFVFGLALGILISMSLISRYPISLENTLNDNFKSHKNDVKKLNSTTLSLGALGASVVINSNPDDSIEYFSFNSQNPTSISSTSREKEIDKDIIIDMQNRVESSIATTNINPISNKQSQASSSFWIPGREGAYLKKNTKATFTVPTDTETVLVEKVAGIIERNNKEKKINTKSTTMEKNKVTPTSSESTANDIDTSNPFLEQNGKRKRGGKEKYRYRIEKAKLEKISVDENNVLDDVKVSQIIPQSVLSKEITVQSRFFNKDGVRIDPLNSKQKMNSNDLLYHTPLLLEYHDQAHQKNPLTPPYIPSLASITAQRAGDYLCYLSYLLYCLLYDGNSMI